MHLIILATGKCKVAPMKALEEMYIKRLPTSTWKVTIRELPDADTPEREAPAQLEALAALPAPCVRILLDELGEMVTSRQLAQKVERWQRDSIKAMAVLIGGANGISKPVLAHMDWVWSLGPLTFPHKLVRVLLAEQIYRAHSLMTGHPYHRD